jgi:probable F420-dependent oxidoreductase
MVKFGVCTRMTDLGIQPLELAQWLENAGFESLWCGEHTHWPDPERGRSTRDPEWFDQLYDPYLTLAAAAAVTKSIRLGLSVSLVTQHHPITLAKAIATLDHLSNGRVTFGIGAGSRLEEVEDFGVRFADRWRITREYMLAMDTIWNSDLAEYHGQHVSFGPLRSWPKPVQPGGPPVLVGAFSKWAARRIAEYGDGWIAWTGVPDPVLLEILEHVRSEWQRAEREPGALDLSMVMNLGPREDSAARERIDFMLQAGFQRIVLLMRPGEPAEQWSDLEWFSRLMKSYR